MFDSYKTEIYLMLDIRIFIYKFLNTLIFHWANYTKRQMKIIYVYRAQLMLLGI